MRRLYTTGIGVLFLFFVILWILQYIYHFFPPYSFEKQKQDAVDRGIRWILMQQDPTLLEDCVWHMKKLYQVTKDTKLSNQLARAIQEKEKKLPEADMSLDNLEKQSGSLDTLLPVVVTVLQKQCVHKDIRAEKAYIRNITDLKREQIFSHDLSLGEKIIGTYYFSELGVIDRTYYEAVVSEIRSKLPPTEIHAYISYLYELTHVIFTKSDYFRTYLDPREYQREIVLLNEAIPKLLAIKEFTGVVADISSEVITSLKLLGQQPHDDIRALSKKIIPMQKPDGSWEGNTTTSTLHHTYVASMALMDFPRELSNSNVYCPFGEKP